MKERFDWTNTCKKVSTWLGILSGASGSALLAYATMPDRVQNLLPDWSLLLLGGCTVIPAFAVGAATAYRQKSLDQYAKITVKSTTEVVGKDAAQIVETITDARQTDG